MNYLSTLGKYLDQPYLVGSFSKAVPAIMLGGAGMITAHKVSDAKPEDKRKVLIQNLCILTGTMGSALVATRGIKKIGLKGLSQNIDLNQLKIKNSQIIDEYISKNSVSENSEFILKKAKNKILKFNEVRTLSKELEKSRNGKFLLKELIPEPENVSSKEIFGEIKRLSLMGLVPVLGGIAGGVVGDSITDNNWKNKIPNKIKEGAYQYLANIFLCNVGAGIALGIMEKAKITSKATRALGMVAGIMLTGIIGGSAIANVISKKVIDPCFSKENLKSECDSFTRSDLYSERHPEAIDIGLHVDDIATVAVLSGLKWIEPALPVLYSISGYRAGIGYRNGNCNGIKK